MTLEERVARLEQSTERFDRIDRALAEVALEVRGLRTDFNVYRAENADALARILATLQALQRRPRWPWEKPS